MKKKNYHYTLKAFILSVILIPGIMTAQVTLDKNGISPVTMKFQQGNQPSVASFFQEYQKAYPLSEGTQMEILRVSSDNSSSHHRYNQYYKGVEVLGAQYILHEKNGSVWFANGHLVPDLDMDVNPAISKDNALQIALNEVNARVYMWDNPANETMVKKEQNDASASFYPKGALKLSSGTKDLNKENIRLVYRFDIYAQEPFGRYWVDVDAKTGDIVGKINRIHDGDVPGSGASLYNGTVPITVDEFVPATSFRLQENTTRGAVIKTFDLQNTWGDYGTAVDFESTSAIGPFDATGVSGHYGAEATYDYFLDKHGRNSIDDAGMNLLSYVHFGVDYVNAFWDGTRMTYGDGNGGSYTALVSLDVCGHELTHGVTEHSSNLFYADESGGLNESFSDIFGNLVEFYKEGYDPEIWRVGEDFSVAGGFRNMANPNEFENPDTYLGDYWFYNEVHNTSGVQNFWFYLLADGGSNTNDVGFAYNVTGIGLDDAGAIAYGNNNSYLTPFSNYDDARIGSIACAEDLFGVGSQQAISTAAAWDAVNVDGVPPPPPPIPGNDLCADAIALSCGVFELGTTLGATFDADAPFCDFPHSSGGVWYTVEGDGYAMNAIMCYGPWWDTRLTVYEGSCGSFSCIGANDDACGPGGTSVVSWLSTAGTTYYILVHGFGASSGDFALTVNSDAPAAISVSPGEFTFTVDLDGNASDIMTISNTGSDCSNDPLHWNIIKTGTTMMYSGRNNTPGHKDRVYTTKSKSEDQEFNYYISENTIDVLENQGFFIKCPVRDQLLAMQDQFFSSKAEFYTTLSKVIGDQNDNIKAQILQYADIRHMSSAGHDFSRSPARKEQVAPSGRTALLRADGSAPKPLNGRDVIIATITHSLSQEINPGGSVACNGPDGTRTNSYWRSFNLSDFYIFSDYNVESVDLGIEYASGLGTQLLTVNLYYSSGAPFPAGTLTPVNSVTYTVPTLFFVLANAPISGTIPAGSELVVEVLSPDGNPDGNSFYFGANDLGQTAPSYISAPDCGVSSPVDLMDIGFPQVHWVMNVTGSYEDPWPWLSISPSAGITAGGSSDDVSVSVDATGLAYGTYQCDMRVLSNDPDASEVIVPVTMVVADITPPVITMEGPKKLWPPDHKYHDIKLRDVVISVVDNVDGNIPVSAVVIDSVSSDEPDNAPGNGDGNTVDDIVIKSDCKSVKVRKERQGSGNGRVYTLNVSVEDAAGNVGTASFLATVPQNNNEDAVDDGPSFMEYSNCSGMAPLKSDIIADDEDAIFENNTLTNYPNPFSGTTTFKFSLEESGHATLTVYNTLGVEVAVLYDGMAEAGQEYTADFSGKNLAEGIYFYRLQSGENVNMVNKMLLVK